MKLINTEGL